MKWVVYLLVGMATAFDFGMRFIEDEEGRRSETIDINEEMLRRNRMESYETEMQGEPIEPV